MDNLEIRLNIIKNVFQSAVGNERLRIIELAQEQYEWVVKEDNAVAPAKTTKSLVAKRG